MLSWRGWITGWSADRFLGYLGWTMGRMTLKQLPSPISPSNPDAAAVGFDQRFDDGKPDAGAAGLHTEWIRRPIEALEDPVVVLRFDAHAAIPHRDEQALGVALRSYTGGMGIIRQMQCGLDPDVAARVA